MEGRLGRGGIVLVLLLWGCRSPGEADRPQALAYRHFPTAGEALRDILDKAKPRVVGFGEFHQKSGSPPVQPSLTRFIDQLLEPLSGAMSDLLVETWVATGDCGEPAKAVVKSVEATIQRPQEAENEVVRLLRAAQEAGVRPHILELACPDYQALLDHREVDYERLLELITQRLQGKAMELIVRPSRGLVVIYGGALHNDLYPDEDFGPFAYGPALAKATQDRYVEVDLYVPEYIEGEETLMGEPWYPVFKEHASPGQVLLIESGPRSYVLILRRGLMMKGASASAPQPPPKAPPGPLPEGREPR